MHSIIRAALVAAAVVLALAVAGSAPASSKRWDALSTQEKVRVVKREIRKHESTIRWVDHRWMQRSGSFLFWPDHAWRVRQRNVVALAHVRAVLAEFAPRPVLPWAFWNCVATGYYPGRGRVSVGEGGATSYNPAGYYGRYQMDWGFMRHWGADKLRKYGGRDARSWSVLDQTIVAERGLVGYRGERGQGPGAWPNTAPPCLGLR